EMKRAMARQAEAERERRAKVISAEGEYQASTKLAAAAEIIQAYPVAMQLRFLQTVVEIAAENNSTTLFPVPIDLFRHFFEPGAQASGEARERALRAAAETVLEALPDTDDRARLEEAARAALGIGRGSEASAQGRGVAPRGEGSEASWGRADPDAADGRRRGDRPESRHASGRRSPPPPNRSETGERTGPPYGSTRSGADSSGGSA